MNKLSPCPHCGSEVKHLTKAQAGSPSGDYGFLATALCTNRECQAMMEKWALKEKWAHESLFAAWNRRQRSHTPSQAREER